ncbi:hypothetical protein [Okeania sp. SIO1I7]|nr:hypothetical protein [Okeania sp. SIO1I7]NET26999.1 hypothetical protein [Okeania sp. SIO1I7]
MSGNKNNDNAPPPLTKSEVRSQKSEVNPPLTPPRRGSRGFELRSKNISP